MDMGICGACGRVTMLVDGVVCEDCDLAYYESAEARSRTAAALAWRRAGGPVEFIDPWAEVPF